MNKDKIIISLQLPTFIHEALKKKADEECTSVSYLIRRLVVKYVNDKEDK
jgi:predicted DNA-binding protein